MLAYHQHDLLMWIVFFISDVKPNNMLVSGSGHVKLCDFGVSIQVRIITRIRVLI